MKSTQTEMKDTPLPVRPGGAEPVRPGRREPPLESRADWDPWIPPRHAYPDVNDTLRTIAGVLVAVILALVMILLLAQFAG